MEIGHNELAPNGEAVAAIVAVGRIDDVTAEVQVAAVGGTIRGGRPVVAPATDAVLRPSIAIDVSGISHQSEN